MTVDFLWELRLFLIRQIFLFQTAELQPYNITMFLSTKGDVRLLINLSHA